MTTLLTILVLVSITVNAQDFWMQTNGPFSGIASAITVSRDNHILAGTDGGGIFRSTNGGG